MSFLLLLIGLWIGTLLGWMLCAMLVKDQRDTDPLGAHDERDLVAGHPFQDARFSDRKAPTQARDHGAA